MPTYTASTAVIPNPERGFFQYTESHYKYDNSGYTPLSASTLTSNITTPISHDGQSYTGMAIVFRYFYMEKYQTVATIEQAYLNLVAADLAAVRASGTKAIIRFAYTAGTDPNSDATPAIVQGHISQLTPIVNQYADVVHAVEAGFVGGYGEWYYTNNFGNQGTLTAQNITDRNAVISSLLTQLDARIFVLLRYIGSRQQYLGTNTPNPGGQAVRLGHHNDAFLADNGNYGTYENFTTLDIPGNRAYLAAMTNVPVGGESANYSQSPSPYDNNLSMGDFPNASYEMSTYKYSFLNPNYLAQVLSAWGQSGVDTVSMKLGYRLRMVSATIPSAASAGATATVSVVVANDGWNAPLRNRPVNLVLDNGSGLVYTYPASVDVRSWGPASTNTLTFSFTAPPAGTYSTYLTLPDASSTIASNTAYNIQLANVGTWNASTGRNALGQPITTSGSGGNTPTPVTSSGLKRITKLNVGGVVKVVKLA